MLTTQLCASVRGTPVDNAAAISSLSDEPGAAALYTSFEADGVATARLAIASSQNIVNSLQIENGGGAVATTASGGTVSVSVTPTLVGTGNVGGSSPTRTGTASIAEFTGGIGGREVVPVAVLVFIVAVVAGAY